MHFLSRLNLKLYFNFYNSHYIKYSSENNNSNKHKLTIT